MDTVNVHRLRIATTDIQDKQYRLKSDVDEANRILQNSCRASQISRQTVADMVKQALPNNLDIHKMLIQAEQASSTHDNNLYALNKAIEAMRNYEDQIYQNQNDLVDAVVQLQGYQEDIKRLKTDLYQLIVKICGNDTDAIDRQQLLPVLTQMAETLGLSLTVQPAQAVLSAEADLAPEQKELVPVHEISFLKAEAAATNASALFELLCAVSTHGTTPSKVDSKSSYGQLLQKATLKFSTEYLLPALIEAVEEYEGPDMVLYGHTRPHKWGFRNPYQDWGFRPIKDASIPYEHWESWLLDVPFVNNDIPPRQVLNTYLEGSYFCGKFSLYDTFASHELPDHHPDDYIKNPEFAAIADLYIERFKRKAEEQLAQDLQEVSSADIANDEQAAKRLHAVHSELRILLQLKAYSPNHHLLLFSDSYGYDYSALLVPYSVLTAIKHKLGLSSLFDSAIDAIHLYMPYHEIDW